MKTATFPSLRVDPELRDAAESVLQEGETLSGLIETSVREAITRRRTRAEFLARGLVARDETRRTGVSFSADEVHQELAQRLAKARANLRKNGTRVSFDVRYSEAARSDLVRLYDYLLDRATTLEELDFADHAYEVIVAAVNSLRRAPFVYRKAGADPFVRELLIPFGNTGYVALFEIQDPSTVLILAVRHQLEDDYH